MQLDALVVNKIKEPSIGKTAAALQVRARSLA